MRAESLSIFPEKSALPAASIQGHFVLSMQMYLGVSHAWPVTAKPPNENKQSEYSNNSGKHKQGLRNESLVTISLELRQS